MTFHNIIQISLGGIMHSFQPLVLGLKGFFFKNYLN